MASDNYHAEDLQRDGRSGRVLAGFTLLLTAGLIHGVLAFGCYFLNEFRRLSDFEIAVLWLGDIIGVFWFLRYVVRWHAGETVSRSRPLENRRLPRSVWVMIGSMALGLLGELAMTLSLREEEYKGFQRAVPTVCTVDAIEGQKSDGVFTFWKLDGQYQDAAGNTYFVTYHLGERDTMSQLPGGLAHAIRQRKTPLSVPIVYDPEHAARSWIPQLGWDDGNRLHYMSLLILFFQFLGSLVFLVCLHDDIKKHRHLPWWAELHNLIPLGTQAFIMALFGGLELYIVRRFCP